MAPKVATLSELLVADGALKWPRRCVLPEVVSQITALTEDRVTPGKLALEVKFCSLRFLIVHFNCLVPLNRHAFKFLLGSSATKWAHLSHTLIAVLVHAG